MTGFFISNKLRNAAILGVADAMEIGSEKVKVQIYTEGGGIPTSEKVALTAEHILLAEHESSNGSDGFEDTSSGGSLSAHAFEDVSPVKGGAPAFFRVLDANGETAMQGTCGVNGQHMIVSDANYIEGGKSAITAFSISIPSEG